MHSSARDNPRDCALLIIDMMNLFDFDGGSQLQAAALDALPAIIRLRRRFDRAGAPVIYVNDNFAHWQGDFHTLLSRCLMAGAGPARIARLLSPAAHHYHVLKPKHSAFLCTPLAVLLAQLGARRLVLTGLSVDSCIIATAMDANMREHMLWVPTDAVAAISPARKSGGLALIRTSLRADVRTTRAITGLFPP